MPKAGFQAAKSIDTSAYTGAAIGDGCMSIGISNTATGIQEPFENMDPGAYHTFKPVWQCRLICRRY